MNERRILEQIARSNNDFHPIIAESKLHIDDKLALQETLNTKFNGNFRALIEDMLGYAIEEEEYELAAIIRDELNK
jgi:protein-arginine kinase activator protein McsA